jgi:hypothetical protein
VEANVHRSLAPLSEQPASRQTFARPDVTLVGGVYDVATGRVRCQLGSLELRLDRFSAMCTMPPLRFPPATSA